MKKSMAILASLTLIVTMCVSLLLPVSAADGDFAYTTNGATATVTAYSGNDADVIVPDTLGGVPVSAIGDNAFAGSTATAVTLPSTVKTIGECAFQNASSLTQITLGGELEMIGYYAFGGCTALATVYFDGNDAAWNAVQIHVGNDALTAATLVCSTDAINTQSLLPSSSSAFTKVASGGGSMVINTAADGAYTFRSNAGWPYAYVDYGVGGGITVDTAKEQYLNYDFEVNSGRTNIIVVFGGADPAEPPAGAYICLNGHVDPGNIDANGTITDLRPGRYKGSIKVSDLGCDAALMTDGTFVISGFKVYSVTNGDDGAGNVTVHTLSVGDSVAKAEMPASARDGEKISVLPASVDDFVLDWTQGILFGEEVGSAFRFNSYYSWPYAYTQKSTSEYVTVDVTADHYLYYDFTVTSGQTNIVVCFGGTDPLANDPYGTWVSLNGLVDPANVVGGVVSDIGIGSYTGCVRVSDLGISPSVLAGNMTTISDVKVFAVSSLEPANVLVKEIAVIKAIEDDPTPPDPATTTTVTSTTTTTTTTTRKMEGELITYTVGAIEGAVGDTVEVPVNVTDGHYMTNGQLILRYDPSALALVAVSQDPELPYFDSVNTAVFKPGTMWEFEVPAPGEARFAFASPVTMGSPTGGTMFTLTFTILSRAADGTAVTLEIPEMCSDNTAEQEDAYNTNLAVVNGAVTVTGGVLKGDVDLSGVISVTDAVMLFQYVNGTTSFNEQQFVNGELTGDGVITVTDAVLLFQYVNGTAVIE